MTRNQGDPAADVAALRRRYCELGEPVAAILAASGLSSHRFYALATREGWPRRSAAGEEPVGRAAKRPQPRPARQAVPSARRSGVAAPAAKAKNAAVTEEPVDRRAMATRLERFIASRIVAIEAEPAPAADGGERQARTLNQLARTAAAIRTYLETLKEDDARDDVDTPPPRSLAELRDELRRHLERIQDEERDPELSGDPDPG